MGLEIGGNQYPGTTSELFEEGKEIGIPDSSDTYQDSNCLYQFEPLLSSEALGQDSLSNSLLNRGFEEVHNPLNIRELDSRSNITPNYSNRHTIIKLDSKGSIPTSNRNAIAKLSSMNGVDGRAGSAPVTGPLPSVSSTNFHTQHNNNTHSRQEVNLGVPTIVSSGVVPHHPRPFKFRPSSLLRNEYRPDTPISSTITTMAGQGNFQYSTSSPARYVLRPPGGMTSQNQQPFQQSDIRSSSYQSLGYNTYHPFGNDLTNPMTLPQFHPSGFPIQGQYTHNAFDQTSLGFNTGEISHFQDSLDDQQPQTTAQPSTPPNLIASYLSNDQQTPSTGVSNPVSNRVKREMPASAMASPLVPGVPHMDALGQSSTRATLTDEEGPSLTDKDQKRVEKLIEAMNNDDKAEDNPGMRKTWKKIRDTKSGQIREVCVGLLDVIKRAQRQELTDKKPTFTYSSLKDRLNETCRTLRTQKTVCKHLMEAPYSHTVASDPKFASMVGGIKAPLTLYTDVTAEGR